MQPMPDKLVLAYYYYYYYYYYHYYYYYIFVATEQKTTSGTRIKKGHTLITGKETVEQED